MLTGIDHLVIAVDDLPTAMATYTNLGFHVHPAGEHRGRGTHSAVIFHDDQYIELTAVRDAQEQRAAAERTATADPGLADYIRAGGGIRAVGIASDDLEADIAAMRARGAEVSDPEQVERVAPDGTTSRWLAAAPPPGTLPLVFVQHLSSLDERRGQAARAPHPNGVSEFDRIYVATPDLQASAGAYHRLLGGDEPKPLQGIIIKANMMVFAFGRSAVVVAEPDGPGPTASALETRGPGVFQVIHNTAPDGDPEGWLQAHGVTPAVGGRRSTGEQVIVVGAADAHGCNMGFVVPER
ncbi:MAG: VOC family protein [Dehalococcoidia bacterium]